MIYIGDKKIGRVFLGETELNRIYLGEDLIFQKDQPIVYKTIRDLIDEEYAETVTGSAGTYIRIKSTCPYQQFQITDLEDFAFNRDQLTSGVNNTIIWDVPLPSGWTSQEVADIYDGQSLPFSPRANIFWALSDLDSFTITFTGGGYQVPDYTWGSGVPNGIFSPRYNVNNESYYNQSGFRNTPKELTVSISSTYSFVAQTMFTELLSTTTLTLNVSGDFAVHDTTGMFEANSNLTTLNINGRFLWSTIRLCHNMFDGCSKLTSIPKISTNARTHAYNILYPRYDGTRGSANCVKAFDCPKLEYLGPILNMNAISLSGCTIDGRSQGGLGAGNLFNCPVLTDVLIQNLNNNNWNFADSSTKTYIPKMDVASIEYLLNNVADCTADPHTVTFSTLHQGEISQSAIDAANAKGWTVAYQAAS